MKNILLDTSVIIDFLRIKDKKKSLLYRLAEEGFILNISIITHTELYAGKSVWEKKEATEELEKLFSGIIIIPFNKDASEKAGMLKAKYDINLLDAIIASTALIFRYPLATLNTRDFCKVDSLSIYRH